MQTQAQALETFGANVALSNMWAIAFILAMGLDSMLPNSREDHRAIPSRMHASPIFETTGLGKCGHEKTSNAFRALVTRHGMQFVHVQGRPGKEREKPS
jgi:hypothetical protein